MRRWPTSLRRLMLSALIAGGGSVVWNTVSGASPLALVNAVAKPIRSLIQYGKCTQASTPTPSAPVDIVTNNGALKMVDDDLPDGYKRVTGIKFDGDFWYETYESLTGEDEVTMTLANTSSTGQNVFGSYNGTSSGTKNFSLYLYGGGNTNSSYFRYGTQLVRPKFGGNEHTITFGKNGTSGFDTDVSVTPDTFTTEANAFIGMLPNSTSPAYTGSIMGSIKVSNRLEWIPCERTNDGTVGYYEKYTAVFLEPTGEGTPIKGAYDYTHSHLAVVGTPETLTVSADGAATQTVSNLPDLLSVGDYKDEADIISGIKTGRVGIKVYTGKETFSTTTIVSQCYTDAAQFGAISSLTNRRLVCTHFGSADSLPEQGSRQGVCIIGKNGVNCHVAFGATVDYPSIDAFKAFLAAQYAAGTPVIVVYPLAEETTEQTTPHSLYTDNGATLVSATTPVDPVDFTAEYAASA